MIENNIQNNIDKKYFDDIITEKLKSLMQTFHIENKFANKCHSENISAQSPQESCITNAQTKISEAAHGFDFNNYYPKNLSFILLDLRINLDKKEKFSDNKPGFLPMTVVIEQEELGDEFVIV